MKCGTNHHCHDNYIIPCRSWLGTTFLRQCCILFLIGMTTLTHVVGESYHDDDGVDETETHAATTTTEEIIRIGSSSSRGTNTAIRQYHPPFTTQYYPYHVANVLQQYPKATASRSSSSESEYDDDDDDSNQEEMHQLLLATWYTDLGMAHRTVMEDYYMEHVSSDTANTHREAHLQMNELDRNSYTSNTNSNNHHNHNFIPIQKVYAVAAFQEAIHIYETLIQNYRQWITLYTDDTNEEDEQDTDIHNAETTTAAAATKDMIQSLIEEYEYRWANTMFALAETYTLVQNNSNTDENNNNNNIDTNVGFHYYHRAYRIYHQQRQMNRRKEQDLNHQDTYSIDRRHLDIHFAHCSIQLGLERMEYLHDLDHDMVADYDENHDDHPPTKDRHRITLSHAMEESILTFDHSFWKAFLVSFQQGNENDNENDDHATDRLYTLESVQEYLRDQHIEFFRDDTEQIEMYILQYILTEQAIHYYIDAIVLFRHLIQQEHQEEPSNDNQDDDDEEMTTTNMMEHRQTLVQTLQNVAFCIYQYRPISTTSTTKAVEYCEEAYDILLSQILPTLVMQQQHVVSSPKYSSEVLRSVHTMTDILFLLTEMYFQLGKDEMTKERMKLCRTLQSFICVSISVYFNRNNHVQSSP